MPTQESSQPDSEWGGEPWGALFVVEKGLALYKKLRHPPLCSGKLLFRIGGWDAPGFVISGPLCTHFESIQTAQTYVDPSLGSKGEEQ